MTVLISYMSLPVIGYQFYLFLFYKEIYLFFLLWSTSCSLTRDQTHAPALGVLSLNHWTVREVPRCQIKKLYI